MASIPERQVLPLNRDRRVSDCRVSGTVTLPANVSKRRRGVVLMAAASSGDNREVPAIGNGKGSNGSHSDGGPISKKTGKILVVEDNAELSTTVAMNAPPDVEVVSMTDPEMVLQICKGEDISLLLVFIDKEFSGMDVNELSKKIQAIRDVNVLLVSSQNSTRLPSINSTISDSDLASISSGEIIIADLAIGDIPEVMLNLPDSSPSESSAIRLASLPISLLDKARSLLLKGELQAKALEGEMQRLRAEFDAMDASEKESLLSTLYTDFSEYYDEFMKTHLDAIVRLLERDAIKYLNYPIIDLSGGTGVVLRHALKLLELRSALCNLDGSSNPAPRGLTLGQIEMLHNMFQFHEDSLEAAVGPKAYFNELSPGMIKRARLGLAEYDVKFSEQSAFDLATDTKMHGFFNTVLLTQTLHILPRADKVRMLETVQDMLAPGGIAVLMEERNFRVSSSSNLGAATMLVDSIASPIDNAKHRIRFMLEDVGLNVLGVTGIEPIDSQPGHEMILFLAQKPY